MSFSRTGLQRKTTIYWFADHGMTVLDWQAKSPDLNPMEKSVQETPDPTFMQKEL